MALHLFDDGDSNDTGKSQAAFAKSKMDRNKLVRLYGGKANIPSSIMKAERRKAAAGPRKGRGYRKAAPLKKKGKYAKDYKAINDTGYKKWLEVSGGGTAAGALSGFPQNVGRSVLLLYSRVGDVVFDPFAGHNSRMELCVRAKREYIGCDLSQNFMKFNRKHASMLRHSIGAQITLREGDSRDLGGFDDEIADFTITSPPYYDIEEYGDEPEQLGKSETYRTFLDGMQSVFDHNYRILKPGAFAAWFVNDFRRGGIFHAYHYDVIRLAKKAGFVCHDVIIVDLGHSFGDIFVVQHLKRKIIPKRHEYGLIFRKPEGKDASDANKPRGRSKKGGKAPRKVAK